MTATASIRIAIAERTPLLREGLRRILDDEPDLVVVGLPEDSSAVVEIVEGQAPDVLILDPATARPSGTDLLRRLAELGSKTRVLILTERIDEADLLEALRLGAKGLVLKHAPIESLLKAVRVLTAGQYWFNRTTLTDLIESLRRRAPATADDGHAGQAQPVVRLTPRETEVARLVGRGCPNREVARSLGISVETVKHHLSNIFNKIGVLSRVELALYAKDEGLIDDSTG